MNRNPYLRQPTRPALSAKCLDVTKTSFKVRRQCPTVVSIQKSPIKSWRSPGSETLQEMTVVTHLFRCTNSCAAKRRIGAFDTDPAQIRHGRII